MTVPIKVIRETPTGSTRAEIYAPDPGTREILLADMHGPLHAGGQFSTALETLGDSAEILGCREMTVRLPSGRRARITFEPAAPDQSHMQLLYNKP